ncbi:MULTISPECIES: PD-(D/E)XK motif protein [unclassified Polaribacter]|uniref:PD-(D/E)XK motif protein n=1 Tax=unclassified Polaribacter TaxID=196858 RepID=UPI0011BE1C0B|nr:MULTISPECIES: PD-(D/E)XK motif protein [unclassified Polaribacter]TXD54409.1 PD-(D/E)XK motif protein [Polaribacter sp. IC063]TXD62760.1 PD-(D/E)XK motif protein [Polaribacter sp. IC066]
MNIREIFSELIDAPSTSGKYNTRLVDFDDANRYKTILAIDKLSDNQQCVLLQLKNGGKRSEIIINNINTLDSIQIDTFPVPDPGTTELDTYYSIKLDRNTEEDIFYTFISDIVETAKKSTTDLIILDILKRVKSWMNFFKSRKTGVLSENGQIGLFAELTMLKVLLENNKENILSVVNSWVGPKKQNQDFIFPNTQAIEVKCTISNNQYEVKINNEYQLDCTGLARLFLAVYQVKRHKIIESSLFQSLPNLIEDVEGLLKHDLDAKFEFEGLLLEVGYLAEAEIEYIDFGFQIINGPDIYDVDSIFPKLARASISNSIKKVEYSLNLQEQLVLSNDINHLITI